MRAITFTRSGNTQFFKGKELVNWGEVYIFLFYWRLSPAFKTGFHFNFWATPALSVSPHDRFSKPSVTFRALGWTCSSISAPCLYLGSPDLGLAWSLWCWAEVKSHLPWPGGNTIPNTAQEAIGPLCCQGTRLPCAQLAQSTAELLSSQLAPSLYCWMGSFVPRCRTWRIPLQNFTRFLKIPYFPSLLRSLWMAAWPSSISATNPISLATFWGHTLPKSFMKMLSRTGSCIDPWGTVLVTCLQPDFALLITALQAWRFSQFSIHVAVCSSRLYINSFTLWTSWGCEKPYWSAGGQCPLLSSHIQGQSFPCRRLSS